MSPKGAGTRPTSDLLRQAMFNVVGPRVVGARVLDVYAGTGAIGLEALSRGARAATFVERAREPVRCLRANLAALDLLARATVMVADAEAALRQLAVAGRQFDCVFLDPPYGARLAEPAVQALASGEVLSDNAVLVIQAFHKEPLPDSVGVLRSSFTRRYGESGLTVYDRVG